MNTNNEVIETTQGKIKRFKNVQDLEDRRLIRMFDEITSHPYQTYSVELSTHSCDVFNQLKNKVELLKVKVNTYYCYYFYKC